MIIPFLALIALACYAAMSADGPPAEGETRGFLFYMVGAVVTLIIVTLLAIFAQTAVMLTIMTVWKELIR